MFFQKTTITRLYPAAQSGTGLISRTSFGFESNGKRFFDVNIPGKPRIEPGMTVVALLEKPDGWENGGLMGWINPQDGSIACESTIKLLGMFLLCTYFAVLFPARAYQVIGNLNNANLLAQLIVATFGGVALRFAYLAAKAALIRRALIQIRTICKFPAPTPLQAAAPQAARL